MSILNQKALKKEHVKIRTKEPYVSAGLNNKFFGLWPKGIYQGFIIGPGTGSRDIDVTAGVSGQGIFGGSVSGFSQGNYDESVGYSIAVHQNRDGFSTTVSIPPGPFSTTTLNATGLDGQRVYVALDVDYTIPTPPTFTETSASLLIVDSNQLDADPSLVVLGHCDVPSVSGTPLDVSHFGTDDPNYPRQLPVANATKAGLMSAETFRKVDDSFGWEDLLEINVDVLNPKGITITPSQKVSQGKRVYTYISPSVSSKFPRDASGLYNGGVSDDQLTKMDFETGVISGAHGVSGNLSFTTPTILGTPDKYQMGFVVLDVNDELDVFYGSAYSTSGDALLDDNLPTIPTDLMQLGGVIISTDVSGSMNYLNNGRDLVWRRPFLNLGGGGSGGAVTTKQFTNDNAGAITIREVVYVKSNGNVDLADASSLSTSDGALGLVASTSIGSAAAGNITIVQGTIVDGFTGLTPGSVQYISTTPGALTETPPSSVGEVQRRVGRALSTTEVELDSDDPVEIV